LWVPQCDYFGTQAPCAASKTDGGWVAKVLQHVPSQQSLLELRYCLIRTEARDIAAVGAGPGRLARCPLNVGEPIPAVHVSRNAPDEAEYNEDISMYLPPTAIELNMCRSGIKSNESLCATIVALASGKA
jgi:hypothetical protein